MKKSSILLKTFVLMFVIALLVTPSAYAWSGLFGGSGGSSGISTDFPTSSGSIEEVDDAVERVWGTVLTVVQILAFAAVVFAGLRYMFASADQKADIKKGLGMLTIGAVLVFAASTVVKFVVNAADEII